ncbi:receptor-type tyrosine-protein phosphatase H-like [Trichomycterus rosablanca]|uniref:receptor-type tyrosine-protein phosphatase H-like n=1 Tax=Trichomycterus rosablanca TaxID=2290929 RepID=UPI002F35CA2A
MNSSVLTHTVFSLSPGTRYSFTLYTVFKGVKSKGFNFTAVTIPSNVVNVSVKARSETAITLEWNKVRNSNAYIYVLRQGNSTEAYTPMYWGGSVAIHTVLSLIPGTKYNFTLYTVFGGERSSGYNFSAVTMPARVDRVNVTQQNDSQLVLSWQKVKSSNTSYILKDDNRTETSIIGLHNVLVLTHTVSSLSPGTKYNFTLYTVFEGVRSRGLNFTAVTATFTVTGLRCERLSGGNALLLVWDAPTGPWTEVEVEIKGRNHQYSNGTRLEFYYLYPAIWYKVTLKLCSKDVKSAPVSISCQTDPRGVIAGVMLAIVFIVFLVCLGVYVNHRQLVLNRKAQSDVHNSPTSTHELEEDHSIASVLAETQNSFCKKQFKSSSKKKRDQPFHENPYSIARAD